MPNYAWDISFEMEAFIYLIEDFLADAEDGLQRNLNEFNKATKKYNMNISRNKMYGNIKDTFKF